jgi:hypothetical protein
MSRFLRENGNGSLKKVLLEPWIMFCDMVALKTRAHQWKWQLERKSNFWELLSEWVEHLELNGAAQIEETATNCNATRRRLTKSTTRQLSKPVLSQLRCRVVSYCQLFWRASVIHLFLFIARKVDEAANFVFIQFIDQEPGIVYMTNATQTMLGRTKEIWLGKKFLLRQGVWILVKFFRNNISTWV